MTCRLLFRGGVRLPPNCREVGARPESSVVHRAGSLHRNSSNRPALVLRRLEVHFMRLLPGVQHLDGCGSLTFAHTIGSCEPRLTGVLPNLDLISVTGS